MTRSCFMAAAVAFVIAIAGGPPPLHAEWIENGIVLDDAVYDGQNAIVLSDGEGGAVIFWERYINESGYLKHDIYAQRLDIYGDKLWTEGGVVVCNAVDEQAYMKAVPDGAGGYIVCWYDQRNSGWGDIYAQRLDNDGNVQWAANGIAVCTATRNQGYPVMTTAKGGGAVIAWLDDRNATGWDIYAQRLSNSGSAVWTADGVAICTDTSWQDGLRIVHNNNKGALLFWEDTRNGNYDIYGNFVDSLGTVGWPGTGRGIITQANNQANPEVVEDGYGGAFIAWVDTRNGNADIFAERTNGGTSNMWSADGIAVCTATGNQNYPTIRKYGQYEAVIAWRDERAGNADLYAQRTDFFGNMIWTANGLAICTYVRDQHPGDIAEDGAGNLIFSWTDSRSVDIAIYVQKVTGNGTTLWETDGTIFVDEYYQRSSSRMAPDGQGGAIVAWTDQRYWQTTGWDIYALRLDGEGYWGYPAPEITSITDVPYDQGGSVTMEFEAGELDVFPYEAITHYSIWRSLSGPQAAAALAERKDGPAPDPSNRDPLATEPGLREGGVIFKPLGGVMYAWECVGTMDAHRLAEYSFTAPTLYDSIAADDGMHYWFVSSNTADPFVFWDSPPDSGYSVDNLAPSPPLGLAGEQSYSPEGLTLTWDPNAEPDLHCYRVYRGLTEGFTPGSGNLVDSPCDTILFDADWEWSAGYWYKVAAVDIHGNESPYAVLGPDGVTGGETPPPPRTSFLAQNHPNPFNPSTTVLFGIAGRARVSLRIYDAAGRLVRVLVDEPREAGVYNEAWDGRDSRGAAVSSGIYFYRLEAGTFARTRKMVLLR